MIWAYIDVNYSSEKGVPVVDFSLPAHFMTIHNIYPYVKNIPKEVEYPIADTFEELYVWSETFYRWLMDNKKSAKFDYDGEKDWTFFK